MVSAEMGTMPWEVLTNLPEKAKIKESESVTQEVYTVEENRFQVGFAKIAATPPMGIHVPGYGFVPRPSDGIIDELYIYAVAFSDGENKAILFNVDALGALSCGGLRIRQKVAQKFDIPVENVYLATTHCHTAMWVGGTIDAEEEEEPDRSYYGRQDSLFCDVAQFALEDLKPATMKIARGEALGAAFLRRYKMVDGTLKTNPKFMDPNILEPDGVQDNSLQLVRLIREGGKEVTLVNFGTHPDCIGGTKYTPDWPGYVVKTMEGALEGQAHVVMLNGFGGDSVPSNRLAPKLGLTKMEKCKRLARKVSGEALRIYDDVKEIPVGKVGGFVEYATFGKNPHEEWEEPIAQQIVDTGAQQEADLPEELRKYNISIKKARRIISNMKRTEDFVIPMYGLQVGNICFIGAPGEPFSETGMNIKNASKMDMTICTCRTNGSEGYFPTPNAYAGGGYERDYTSFGPDCSGSITAAAIRMIDKMERTQPLETE